MFVHGILRAPLDSNPGVTQNSISAQEQNYIILQNNVVKATPEQRIDMLVYLWGGQATKEIRLEQLLIDKHVSLSAGDNQENHLSARFSLALSISSDFSHNLGLNFEQSAQLSSILYASDSYESMGEKIRNLLCPLQKPEPQPEPESSLGIHGTINFQNGFAETGFHSRTFADLWQVERSDNQAISERSANEPAITTVPDTTAYRNKVSMSEQSSARFLEPVAPSNVKKLKEKLSRSFDDVAAGLISTREFFGHFSHVAKRSMSRAFGSMKDSIQIGGQKLSESVIDAGTAVANAYHGKTVARIKSSASRAADRLVEGGKMALNFIQLAGGVVAHVAVHGSKAAASFFDKAANFIGNRLTSLRGFDRV